MGNVKSPAGSVRAERASMTRNRILAAARAGFARQGYGATTLREIAEEAGVAVQTVYAVYGSKANILRALRLALRDDAGADAAFGAALLETDPRQALALFARSIRLRWEAGHDIVATHVEAASIDPAVRDEVAAILAVRRRGIGELARAIAGRLPEGPDAAWIGAVIDALTLAEMYAELVQVQGWSPDAYEAWLADALVRLLERNVIR